MEKKEFLDLGSILDVVKNAHNQLNIPYIEVRQIFLINEELCDEFVGCCAYLNNELVSLDGDNYSLKDKYHKWETWEFDNETLVEKIDGSLIYKTKRGDVGLTVWFCDVDKKVFE